MPTHPLAEGGETFGGFTLGPIEVPGLSPVRDALAKETPQDPACESADAREYEGAYRGACRDASTLCANVPSRVLGHALTFKSRLRGLLGPDTLSLLTQIAENTARQPYQVGGVQSGPMPTPPRWA